MTRFLAVFALAITAVGCARNYRLDDGGRTPAAPRRVFQTVWHRPLVARGLLDFRPQEWARALIDESGRVYIGSSAGRFLALDGHDGRTLWSFKVEGAISSTPTLDASTGTLYFGADDGKLYALDRESGRLKWSYATQGTISPAPVVAQGFLLFTSSEGRLYALDATTGKWRWQYDREFPEGFTIQGFSGVAVRGSTAYTGFADGTLVAVRVFSGDVVWTRSLKGGKKRFVDVDATPVLDGDLLYTTSYASGLYAVSLDTGSIRWQHPVEGASAVTCHEGRIYFTGPDVGVVALDRSGHVLWRQGVRRGVPSTPVASGPYLFVSGTESGLYAVAAQDGRLLQYFDPGHGISAPPAVGKGVLAALTNQGRLYLFRIPTKS